MSLSVGREALLEQVPRGDTIERWTLAGLTGWTALADKVPIF